MQDINALLTVSFGTSYPDVIDRCIAPVEQHIARALGVEAYRAFTSRIIMKKLRDSLHIDIDNPRSALERLAQTGCGRITVQPTHILPGSEYHDLLEIVKSFAREHAEISVAFGQPLFYEREDYARVARAIVAEFPAQASDEAIILFGHGSDHFSNACYYAFAHYIAKEREHVYIGNVEGDPTLEDVIFELKRAGLKRAHLLPFMLVAGDHAQNDMAGDDDDSWKSILKRNGISVEYSLRGIGENPAVCELYAQKALNAQTL